MSNPAIDIIYGICILICCAIYVGVSLHRRAIERREKIDAENKRIAEKQAKEEQQREYERKERERIANLPLPPMRMILKTAQRLYGINKKIGGAIFECTEMLYKNKSNPADTSWYIKPEKDIFYFGAMNMINAKWRLDHEIAKSEQGVYGLKNNIVMEKPQIPAGGFMAEKNK